VKNSRSLQCNEHCIGRLTLLSLVRISFHVACGLQSGLVPSGFRMNVLLTFSLFIPTIRVAKFFYLEFITAVLYTSSIHGSENSTFEN
jgi:uncharacterized membrane protein YqaE (UPF0057 family)